MLSDRKVEPINEAEIRFQLDEICKSATFRRSKRAREILSYVINRDLSGDDRKLTAIQIRDDVMDGVFSPDDDETAAVRVQMGRVRRLLDTYYQREGADAPIRISIGLRSYSACYERRVARSVGADDVKPEIATMSDQLVRCRRIALALASVSVLMLFTILQLITE